MLWFQAFPFQPLVYPEKWCTHTGAGHWPDADMLPVGAILQVYNKDAWTKFTEDEQITMMSLWGIFRSPLMIGGEMTKFDKFTMDLLTNEGILAMHRNARHSHQVWRREVDGVEHIVWTAVSSEGGQYVAVFNAGDKNSDIKVNLAELEIYEPVKGTELWSGETVEASEVLPVALKSHGAKVYFFR